uniref:Mitochondrial import inner membrane translocase subunit Tim21 n=1 Tax=Aegilops tauschii TaxID=37682 RepID=R7W4C1_AEGTA
MAALITRLLHHHNCRLLATAAEASARRLPRAPLGGAIYKFLDPSYIQEKKDLSTVGDPFDAPTYNIPEKPVTFAEGASYSVVILAGLGVAALAGYSVFKELIFEPKEYKIFGKALARVQSDSQVTARIGYPITGYGNESRNRAARQRIPNRVWTDEDGVEHVEVNFYIRGPHGAGKVYSEMFKDNSDRTWKFMYLLVEFTASLQGQVMLESYIPA